MSMDFMQRLQDRISALVVIPELVRVVFLTIRCFCDFLTFRR